MAHQDSVFPLEAPKEKTGLSVKELALYVGVPVATVCVAGGLYYYFSKSTKQSKQQEDIVDNDNPSVAPISLTTTEIEEIMTPLQKAQSAKLKGNKYFKAGRYEQAIQCYTDAINECPINELAEISTFYQNRAAASEQLKKWDDVVTDTTKAIDLNPRYTKALGRRARAYEMLDQKRDCLEDVTAVCLLEGFQNQGNMMLADRILKSFGKELAEKHFKSRPHVLPSSTFVQSYLDSFNENIFVVDVPEDERAVTVYHQISQAMESKNHERIVQLCTKEITEGIAKDGKYKLLALLLRGTMYTLMCHIVNAMLDLDEVISTEDTPDNKKIKVDALIKRGSLKMQEAKDKECYEDFDKALQLDEDNANIYHHRGQLYFLTERLEEARKEFERAIALDGKFVAPRLQLGYCLCKIAMQTMQPSLMREANQMLEKATELFPECPEAWSLYGQLLQDQQQLDEALEKLEKAISLAPTNPTTYVYKALLMLQWKQDVEAANKLIRKAIELDEKCDFAYETLATLEVQKGNNEEAIRLFEKAVDLVRTESEMANTFSLLEAAKAQSKVIKHYGITLPKMPQMM